MARSQETFSKKEKEKKRKKKKEDKEFKREERKTNSSKGKGLESMLVYIDDDGNFTSTPPDPKKKKIVKQEDMIIGVPKQEAPDPADLLRKGTVTHFNTSKGYGFIKDHESQESIFVHQNELTDPVKENDNVTFEVEKGPKGFIAVNVKVVA